MGDYSGLLNIFEAQDALRALQKCRYCSVKASGAKSTLGRSLPREVAEKR